MEAGYAAVWELYALPGDEISGSAADDFDGLFSDDFCFIGPQTVPQACIIIFT